jgi:DNA-binding transcriptional ArsR family regulator
VKSWDCAATTSSSWSTPRATRRFDKFSCPIDDVAIVELLHDPERVRAALSPIRRTLLGRLRQPSSATRLAAELGLPRQRVNYHLRELERAGLVELVEERQRRGCTERVLAARSFVVDPGVIGAQDDFAAGHLVNTAAGVVRDVTRMQDAAERRGERLLTFTVEAEVGFEQPEDLDRFTEAIARIVAAFDAPGRRYRVVVGGHPAPAKEEA